MVERKFLWRPDPVDTRDWLAEPVLRAARLKLAAPPERAKFAYLVPQILDQGSLGSCASNATAYALRGAMLRLGAVSPPFASRLALYYFARAQDGATQEDSGTYLRAGFKVIGRIGFCSETAWSYDDGPEKFKRMPDAAAVRLGFDQITGFGYRRIDSTGAQRVADVRTALAARYLVVFGTQVSDKFARYQAGDPPLAPPGAGETILGGHALTLGGYGPGFFDVVNSWGLWGDAGWCQMTDAYIADARSDDFWIVETAPNFSELRQ
jgi:hypothetical protein